MLYTKIQLQSFLGFGEENLTCVLPYMGMAAILFDYAAKFEQIVKIPSPEGPL